MNPPHKTPTIVNVQILRFFAAFWVVFYHSQYFIDRNADVLALPRFMKFLQNAGFVGVDIFFVISGTIMALTTHHLSNDVRHSLKFASVRFARIYTGWWPLFVLYWAGAMVTDGLKDKWFFSSLLLLPVTLPHYITGVLWTLSFELYFYVLVALLILLPQRWRNPTAAILLLGVAAFTVWSYSQAYFTPARQGDAWPIQGFIVYPLIAEFLAGFLLYEWVRQRQPTHALPWAVGAVLMFAAAAAYQIKVAGPKGMNLDGFFGAPERALLVGGFAVCLVAVALIAKPWHNRLGQILAHWGDASYAIYLSHILVMLAATKTLAALGWPNNIYTPKLLILLAAVLIFSILYYRLIELPLYRRVRRGIERMFVRA